MFIERFSQSFQYEIHFPGKEIRYATDGEIYVASGEIILTLFAYKMKEILYFIIPIAYLTFLHFIAN